MIKKYQLQLSNQFFAAHLGRPQLHPPRLLLRNHRRCLLLNQTSSLFRYIPRRKRKCQQQQDPPDSVLPPQLSAFGLPGSVRIHIKYLLHLAWEWNPVPKVEVPTLPKIVHHCVRLPFPPSTRRSASEKCIDRFLMGSAPETMSPKSLDCLYGTAPRFQRRLPPTAIDQPRVLKTSERRGPFVAAELRETSASF